MVMSLRNVDVLRPHLDRMKDEHGIATDSGAIAAMICNFWYFKDKVNGLEARLEETTARLDAANSAMSNLASAMTVIQKSVEPPRPSRFN